MELEIGAQLGFIKNGVQAVAHNLGLAGHGKDEAEAVEALRAGVEAWARALKRAERLADALLRVGVVAKEPDDPRLRVAIRGSWS